MRVYTLQVHAGQQLGRYTVIAPIGRGGMGGVYEVTDERGQIFALKSPIVGDDATARFAREANALRLLDHPNLVAAQDVFVADGALYLVMERVHGRTLYDAIRDGLSPRTTLVLVRQILEGVGHAHANGIVHRDLKPDNVLLVDLGGWERAKIIDFGLVKLIGDAAAAFGAQALTRTGLVFGTPAYMAPEQAMGKPIDARSDLYTIGVLIFEMLTGRRPFEDKEPQLVMRAHVRTPPPRLDETVNAPWVTPPLCALVAGALEKVPEHRFQSAQQMIALLDDAFGSLDAVT
jgi:serine/threonine protein kinase